MISESKCSPLIPFRSNVAVASEIKKVSNPRFPAILVVVEIQWFVVSPTITSELIPKVSKRSFKSVPINALLTSLIITGSPLMGFSWSIISKPGCDLCNFDSGFFELCIIWKTGRLKSRHLFKISNDFSSASLLFLLPPHYSSSLNPFWRSIKSNAAFFFSRLINTFV